MNFRVTAESHAFVYEIIKSHYKIGENAYLLECTKESDMLADNSTSCVIHANLSLNSNFTPLVLRNFNSGTIDSSKTIQLEIADVRGIWSGIIIENNIEGANFAFISQNYLIVKKDSILANEIRKLYANKMNFKICEIASLLQKVIEGFPDESILKYL